MSLRMPDTSLNPFDGPSPPALSSRPSTVREQRCVRKLHTRNTRAPADPSPQAAGSREGRSTWVVPKDGPYLFRYPFGARWPARRRVVLLEQCKQRVGFRPLPQTTRTCRVGSLPFKIVPPGRVSPPSSRSPRTAALAAPTRGYSNPHLRIGEPAAMLR